MIVTETGGDVRHLRVLWVVSQETGGMKSSKKSKPLITWQNNKNETCRLGREIVHPVGVVDHAKARSIVMSDESAE